MGLPTKLKNFICFIDGVNYAGEIPEITLPTLTRKMEGYRGGGMGGEIKYDMGQDDMELEIKGGGIIRSAYRSFGIVTHDGVMMRFAGAYQRPDTGAVTSREVIVRGRYEEIDPGSQKAGDDTEQMMKMTLSYYKDSIDGEVMVEIDIINNILISGGIDRMADIREALGQF